MACLIFCALAGCSDSAKEAVEAGALAQRQLENGNLVAAKRSITEALAARDDIVELHLLRGRIELAAGSRSGAYEAYREALSLDRSNGEALQGVSQLGLSTGHLRESLEATERILTLAPQQPDALLIRGIHSLIRRRHDEAISYADQILANEPGHENASILKARALFVKGRPDDALAVADAVAGPGVDSAGIALTKLELFRELRRPDDMERQFARLRELRPDDLSLRLDEANLLFKRDRRGLAQQRLKEVLLHTDATSENLDQAVGLWREYGAEDVADGLFEEISATASPRARQEVARFLIEQNKISAANGIVTTLEGDDRLSLVARVLAARREFGKAKSVADQVLARDDTRCDALLARSEAQLGLKDPAAALRDAQHAASECPNLTAAWLVAARAYAALNRSSGVERIYSQARDANPQDWRLVEAYTTWLLDSGRSREALAVARRFTRNSPASLRAWSHYRSLCQRTQSGCEVQAAHGLEDARTRFGIDLKPGALAPNGLFGRFANR